MAFKNLTSGSVPRLLIMLALPVMGSFVLQSLYSLVDLYFVGLLGGAPVAGLGIALNTFFLVLALGQTIGVGTLAVLSRSFGAGELDRVTGVFRQSFLLVLAVGGAAWLAGFLAAESYISAFTMDAEVQAAGVAYFQIYSATFLLQLFLMVNGFAWRALGDFITPTVLMLFGVGLNIVLDPLLIFGWGPVPALGIAGAAWATVIAEFAACLLYLYLIFGRGGRGLLTLGAFPRIEWPVVWRILRIGLPVGLQFLLATSLLMVMFRYVMPFGAHATAAVAVGFRLIHSAVLPAVAICSAVATMVGQNYGARNFSRIKASILWGGGLAATLLGAEYLAFYASPSFWVGLFSNDPGVIAVGSDYLLITGLVLPFHALGMNFMFTCQGLGRTMIPLVGIGVRVTTFFTLLLTLGAFSMITPKSVFWSSSTSIIVEVTVMGLALIILWRTYLREPPEKSTGQLPPKMAGEKSG